MDSSSWVSDFLIPWSQSFWIETHHLIQYLPPGTRYLLPLSVRSHVACKLFFSNVTKIIPETYWSCLLLAYLWESLGTFLSHSVFSDFTLIIWNWTFQSIYTVKIGKFYKLRLLVSLPQLIVTHLPEQYLPKHFYPDVLETTFFFLTFHLAPLFRQIIARSHLTICHSRPKITKPALGISFPLFFYCCSSTVITLTLICFLCCYISELSFHLLTFEIPLSCLLCFRDPHCHRIKLINFLFPLMYS